MKHIGICLWPVTLGIFAFMVRFCWLFVYGYHTNTYYFLSVFLFSSNPVSSSCRWASHSHHIHDHTANCTCVFPLRLSVKQYFTSLKPSQDVCFWRVLICILNIPNAGHFVNFWYTYMNDFYFHCHDKDLWSSLLCRLYWWWKMSHIFLFLFLCIILQLFCAVFLLHSVKFYCCYIITIIAELTA